MKRKPKPPPRPAEVVARRDGGAGGWMKIPNHKGEAELYAYSPLECAWCGRAWRLRKLTGERAGAVYDVRLAVNGNADHHECECQGHYRHSHCKHVDALAILSAAQLL